MEKRTFHYNEGTRILGLLPLGAGICMQVILFGEILKGSPNGLFVNLFVPAFIWMLGIYVTVVTLRYSVTTSPEGITVENGAFGTRWSANWSEVEVSFWRPNYDVRLRTRSHTLYVRRSMDDFEGLRNEIERYVSPQQRAKLH